MQNNICNYKKTSAIVLAGGRGSRMESDIPKQYMELDGKPLIYYSLKAFEDSFIDEIILVCGAGDEEYCKREIVDRFDFKKVTAIVAGGKERYHSVANGLGAIKHSEIVFIHDGARICITRDILERCYADTYKFHACVAAVPAKDTIKLADTSGFSSTTPDRSLMWIVQTPQTFDFDEIKSAYHMLLAEEENLISKGIKITDDAMVMELFGKHKVKLTMGDYRNIKVTTPEDMDVVRVYLGKLNS